MTIEGKLAGISSSDQTYIAQKLCTSIPDKYRRSFTSERRPITGSSQAAADAHQLPAIARIHLRKLAENENFRRPDAFCAGRGCPKRSSRLKATVSVEFRENRISRTFYPNKKTAKMKPTKKPCRRIQAPFTELFDKQSHESLYAFGLTEQANLLVQIRKPIQNVRTSVEN